MRPSRSRSAVLAKRASPKARSSSASRAGMSFVISLRIVVMANSFPGSRRGAAFRTVMEGEPA